LGTQYDDILTLIEIGYEENDPDLAAEIAQELASFEEVFEETLERFTKCNRTRKREILKLIKTAAKRAPGEKKNAGNT
jgi:uncharacterized protein involved in exopolysaccharide biosynthesis